MNAVPGCLASVVILESLSGAHVLTCSGYEAVSHIAMPNQNAGVSWKLHDRPGFTEGGGSLGNVTCHWLRLPAPGTFE
jgi:hypothetical protein